VYSVVILNPPGFSTVSFEDQEHHYSLHNSTISCILPFLYLAASP